MSTTLIEMKSRLAKLLGDESSSRFNDSLLEESLRQGLDLLDQRLPYLRSVEVTVENSGAEQVLPAWADCLYLVSVRLLNEHGSRTALEAGSGFTYQFEGDSLRLHFGGRLPRAGERLEIEYAARYSLSGLDGAATTHLPASYESALAEGAAGQACLLRGTRLIETYGTRPAEANQLLAVSQRHQEVCEKTISNLKVLQEFGFPPGFPLDDADDQASGGF
jgi:hypothetical protein